MNILFLGPERPDLYDKLRGPGDHIQATEEPLTAGSSSLADRHFLISYRYRHRVPGDVLAKFPSRAINLHLSLLPWNRGSDPNLWSFLEDTPKGVTIHAMVEQIDKGALLVQREVVFRDEATLRTTYDRLVQILDSLLLEHWPALREGHISGRPQPAGGSSHRLRDKEPFLPLLVKGWDTPVSTLIGKALRARN